MGARGHDGGARGRRLRCAPPARPPARPLTRPRRPPARARDTSLRPRAAVLALSRGGILSGSADSKLKVWAAGSQQATLTQQGSFVDDSAGGAAAGGVYALAEAKGLGQVFSGHQGAVIKVWGAESGRCVNVLKGHGSYVTAIFVSDAFVFSASSDRTWKVGAQIRCAIRRNFM